MGLGIHSVLSGVALGSSADDAEAVSLGVAILSHKYLASFAVGVPLNKSVISLRVAMGIALCFSMLTPIGILVGFLLQSSFAAKPWISDIFICVAAGTFLYVSICEIMIPEFRYTLTLSLSRSLTLSHFDAVLLSEDKKIERKLYQSMKAQSVTSSDCSEQCDSKHCRPKQEDHDELKKMASVLIGFAVMSALAMWL